MLALLARADGCTVAYHVGRERSVEHLLQQAKGLLPVLALLARADGCIVAYHAGRERSFEHALERVQGSLPITATCTCRDTLCAFDDPSLLFITHPTTFAALLPAAFNAASTTAFHTTLPVLSTACTASFSITVPVYPASWWGTKKHEAIAGSKIRNVSQRCIQTLKTEPCQTRIQKTLR